MKFHALTPNLMVEDVEATIHFYSEVLGFRLHASVPETGKPAWAMMSLDSVSLMFQSKESLVSGLPLMEKREIGGSLTLYIDVEEIEELYNRVRDRAEIVVPMNKTFYGTQEFSILDNNGYVLSFAEDE